MKMSQSPDTTSWSISDASLEQLDVSWRPDPIHVKRIPQSPRDEPASGLRARIREQREANATKPKRNSAEK